jgi:hypothetical protein
MTGEAGYRMRVAISGGLKHVAILELEFVVLLMCPDPEPVVTTVSLSRKSTVAAADFDGVNFTLFCGSLEMDVADST